MRLVTYSLPLTAGYLQFATYSLPRTACHSQMSSDIVRVCANHLERFTFDPRALSQTAEALIERGDSIRFRSLHVIAECVSCSPQCVYNVHNAIIIMKSSKRSANSVCELHRSPGHPLSVRRCPVDSVQQPPGSTHGVIHTV